MLEVSNVAKSGLLGISPRRFTSQHVSRKLEEYVDKMSAKTKHLSSARPTRQNGLTGPGVTRNQANASIDTSSRQRPRYQVRQRLLRWDRILLLIGVVVVVVLLGGAIVGEITTPKGTIAAAQTSYNFGDVPIAGGDISTRFPLTVQGDARAVDITST